MGSGCSSGTEKKRSHSVERRSKVSRSSHRKRTQSLTSSSEVNVHMDEILNKETIEEVNVRLPTDHNHPDVLNQEVKSSLMTSSITGQTKPVRTSQTSIETRVISMEEYPMDVQHLLLGNVRQFRDIRPRTIKLFISACESDSKVERLAITRHVIQPLSDMCSRRRFSLELLDPHWLGCDQSEKGQFYLTNDFLRDSDETPTVVLILLNDKVGSSLPFVLPEVAIEKVTNEADDNDKKLIGSFYTSDEISDSLSYHLVTKDCCKSHLGGIARQVCDNCAESHARIKKLLYMYRPEAECDAYMKSAFEEEVNHIIGGSKVPLDNVFVLRRTFTGVKGLTGRYMDLDCEGQQCQRSANALSRIRTSVDNNVPIPNCFNFELKWTANDLDPVNVREHAQYEESLCNTIKTELSRKLNSLMDMHSPTILPNDIPDNIYQEIVTHTKLCKKLSKIYPSSSTGLEKVRSYLCNADQTPLVVLCEKGTDTHAVTSCVASLPVEKNMATVVRFQGLSPESQSVCAMLSGVCDQLACIFSKVNLKKDEKCFHELLKSATEQRPLLIVLGEVTHSTGTWLPSKLPPHVKIVLVVNDNKVAEDIRTQISKDCVLNISSTSMDLRSTIKTNIQNLDTNGNTSPSGLDLVGGVSSLSREPFCDISSSSVIPTNGHAKKDSFVKFCESLESNFNRTILSKLLEVVIFAKSGLSSFHIAVLLSQDEEVVHSLRGTDPAQVIHTLLLIWMELELFLKPFVHTISYNGCRLHRIYNSSLRTLLTNRFLSSSAKNIHQRICAFCDSMCCGIEDKHKKHPFYLECLEFIRYLEHPHHHKMSRKEGFLSAFVFNLEWLMNKIESSSTLCVIEDLLPSDDEEVILIAEILNSSSGALDVSSRQLPTHLLSKTSQQDTTKLPNIQKVLTECKQQGNAYFTSNGLESKSFENGNPKESDVLTGLFWVPHHSQYVISLSQGKGEVVVWDTHLEEPIRTIRGVDRPVNLKMLDSFHSLVLSNRELKIYNLNEGCLKSSLRGVLNLMAPMFDVMNDERVITVSRNRMYINVLDIASGDTVATFKAGEDRFLNSLLVSKNGKMLVCGDETQKPSPLLVWGLEESRLIHDLRMSQHEFITSISAITDDGHYVVCAAKELDSSSPNFLVVYDLISGQIFKIWKWEHDVTCVAVMTSSKCVISGLNTGDVIVWDLVSGNAKFHMKGVNSVFNRLVLSANSDLCVTWYKGESTLPHSRTVCVWNATEGNLVACLTLDARPSCCEISPLGDAVIVGLPGQEKITVYHLKSKYTLESASDKEQYGDMAHRGAIYEI